MGLAVASCYIPAHKDLKPDYLFMRLSTDPLTLNPLLAHDAYSSSVTKYLYETLLERDNETTDYKGLLAESWHVSADHLTYRFTLRKGITFIDGHEVDADDVIFSYNRIMDEKNPNIALKSYYKDVKSVRKTGKYSVEFKMSRRYFMTLGFLGGIYVMPQHIFSKVDFIKNEYNRSKPIGTGPYKFVEWKTRQKLVLQRNENYWGKKPAIKRIVFRIIEDENVALEGLKKNEIDILNLNPFQWQRKTVSEAFNNDYQKLKYLSSGYRYIGYNTRIAPFNDKRVREAMVYLVNRDEIKEKLLYDLVEITTGPFWINSKQYNHDLKRRRFNPHRAKELLAQAGYKDTDNDGYLDKNGKRLSFELIVPSGSEFYQQFSAIVKEDMRRYGVDLQILQLQFQAIIDKMQKRQFQAYMLGWSMGLESDPYQLWHSSMIEKGDNYPGFATAETDRLITTARTEFNEDKRNAMFHRFHEIMYNNQPYTFLFTSYSLVAVNRRFKNIKVYKTGLDILEWQIDKDYLE